MASAKGFGMLVKQFLIGNKKVDENNQFELDLLEVKTQGLKIQYSKQVLKFIIT